MKYKKQIPFALQRRIIRLAALFELADQEFVQIKLETENLEREAIERYQNTPVVLGTGGGTSDGVDNSAQDQLDSFSFLSIMQRFGHEIWDKEAVDGFVASVVATAMESNRDIKANEFAKYMTDHNENVTKYADVLRAKGFKFNPFTQARHVLFSASSEVFEKMLYPRQRERFRTWMQTGNAGEFVISE